MFADDLLYEIKIHQSNSSDVYYIIKTEGPTGYGFQKFFFFPRVRKFVFTHSIQIG